MESLTKIPLHVGIIMDGNGRWAKLRGKKRSFGHKQGSSNVDKIASHAFKIGVKTLSLYAFSTENWARPKEEVDELMRLLKVYFTKFIKKVVKNQIRLNVMGDISVLTEDLQKVIQDTWYHYPYDDYQGTYKANDGKLTLNHLYESETTVQINVKEIEVEFISHSSNNKIILEIVSSRDQTIPITLYSENSPDNLADGDRKELSLKAGVPQTVELTFGGFPYAFWIHIYAGNTRVTINLKP